MRKLQKNQIISTIGLLEKAHDAIKKAMDVGNPDAALTLLEQCQDSAIQIGGMIEESEGEGFATVELLENYCELLYLTYESIRQQQPVNVGKTYKNLRRELIRIENSVKNDIPVRTSAVFLPYKASMWDSLESVWKAADADPDCDAYVVPIPYFDKNPDGSFSRMHYEGELYPEYVPIVSWEAFDLEKEHPDVIYIHNPYDECNHVTSVHPFFYARELRKFTDKLVYIPYFVLPEINPDDQAAIDGMKHFCFTPGTIYANQVIVQSEDMRQIYINEYLKAAREMGLPGEHVDRKFLEKKFLGTGSPKIDKVLNTRKEELEIPAEWLRIIEKPDGSWKKVVFYNTGIGALLQHDEKMLKKMEDVFRIFKENRDQVALLWRPHPLIKATVESMRPQLWIEYNKLVGKYCEEGWGIYDDSVDLDRAIALSSAYYGDTSSVVQLCKKVGLSVLIEQAFLQGKDNLKYLFSFEELYDDGEVYWFTSLYFNALFKMDKHTWQVEFIGSFPNEKIDGYRLYSSILEYKDKLYFAPLRAKEIGVFNKKSRAFSKIAFEKENIGSLEGDTGWNFSSAYQYGESIYFIPHQRTFILKWNLKTETIDFLSDWYKSMQENNIDTGTSLFFRTCRKENVVYAPFNWINYVMAFNLETEQAEVIRLGEGDAGYADICYDGRKFWMAPLKGRKILQWDEKENVCEGYRIASEQTESFLFWGCEYFDGEVYFFPNEYNKILKVDVKDGAAKCLKEIAVLSDVNRDILGSHYTYCKADPCHMMTYDKDGFLSEYKKGKGRVRREPLRISPNGKADLKKFLFDLRNAYCEQENEVLSETVFFLLDDYIRHMTDVAQNRKENPIE